MVLGTYLKIFWVYLMRLHAYKYVNGDLAEIWGMISGKTGRIREDSWGGGPPEVQFWAFWLC